MSILWHFRSWLTSWETTNLAQLIAEVKVTSSLTVFPSSISRTRRHKGNQYWTRATESFVAETTELPLKQGSIAERQTTFTPTQLDMLTLSFLQATEKLYWSSLRLKCLAQGQLGSGKWGRNNFCCFTFPTEVHLANELRAHFSKNDWMNVSKETQNLPRSEKSSS